MDDSTYHMQVCLLYDFKQGKTVTKPHGPINMVFGDESISNRRVRRWFPRFREGNEERGMLDNEQRGHPTNVLDQGELRDVVERDPSLTTRTLADIFGTSHITIEKYLYNMGKINCAEKWVPHTLSDADKASRIPEYCSTKQRLLG